MKIGKKQRDWDKSQMLDYMLPCTKHTCFAFFVPENFCMAPLKNNNILEHKIWKLERQFLGIFLLKQARRTWPEFENVVIPITQALYFDLRDRDNGMHIWKE